MTITRRWQCGFETGSADEISGGKFDIIGAPIRSGLWSNRIQPFAGNAVDRSFNKNVATTRQIRVGFAVNMANVGTAADGEILVIYAGVTKLLEIRTVQASNDIQLIVAGSQEDVTIDSPLTVDTWFHFGMDCKIDSSTGWAYVYLNGVEILSFEGNTGNADIDNVLFGSLTDTGTLGYWYYDDCYIDDTTGEGSAAACPLLKFEWIYPNANGNYSQWVGSDGDSVNNYQLVDERPPNTNDYVVVSGTNKFDSYGMTTFALDPGQTIEAIIPIGYLQRYGTNERVALGTRYSGIDLIGSNQDPGFGAWGYLWERQTTKPGGGAWDQTSLDGLEDLIMSTGTFS